MLKAILEGSPLQAKWPNTTAEEPPAARIASFVGTMNGVSAAYDVRFAPDGPGQTLVQIRAGWRASPLIPGKCSPC